MDSSREIWYPITVNMLGAKSGLVSGKIVQYDCTINRDGIKTTGLCSATYKSVNGDSGAPVMLYEGNFDGSRYTLQGIHSGHNDKSGMSFFAPYKNIVDELGVTFVAN